MAKEHSNIQLSSYDDIFGAEKEAKAPEGDVVVEIPLGKLHAFEGHPFKVKDDEDMAKTVESIQEFGVLQPAIVRPDGDGYEILSGHRRHHACEIAGIETLPCIVRDLDDDAATILMVDSNLQREEILPSERAWAYKMKLDAIRHQGERDDLNVGDETTCRQVVDKLKSADILGKDTGESGRQIQRYIRLTNLCPELLDMVDDRQIAFNPAVELSFLTLEQQKDLLEAMDYAQSTPSLSQAQRIKKMAQENKITSEGMEIILSEEKKQDLDRVTLKHDTLKKYFPKSYTPKMMEDQIIKLLQQWQKKRDRDMSL